MRENEVLTANEVENLLAMMCHTAVATKRSQLQQVVNQLMGVITTLNKIIDELPEEENDNGRAMQVQDTST